MAGAAGFEPATPGFGDRCSSQLSYAPIGSIIAKNQLARAKNLLYGSLALDPTELRAFMPLA